MEAKEIYKDILSLVPYKSNRHKDFIKILNDAFKKYSDIIEKVELQDKEEVIKDARKIMDVIQNIVVKSYEGCHSEAYKSLISLWKEEYDKIGGLYATILDSQEKKFYRMRIFENRRVNISRDEMFHIPLNMRREIRTQRYSTPGYPCLYMGMSVYACWEEMGRPRMSDCWVSMLENQKQIILLDLRVPDEDTFKKKMSEYIKTFPLIIACMVPIKDNEDVYKPEYIIPQLMMEWVINTKEKVYGILYTSVMAGDDFNFLSNKRDNVAIPVKQPLSQKKFCPTWREMFHITEPINLEIEKLKFEEINCGTYNSEGSGQTKVQDHMQRGESKEEEDKNYENSDFKYLEKRLNVYIPKFVTSR